MPRWGQTSGLVLGLRYLRTLQDTRKWLQLFPEGQGNPLEWLVVHNEQSLLLQGCPVPLEKHLGSVLPRR